jgi:hypothetical protein
MSGALDQIDRSGPRLSSRAVYASTGALLGTPCSGEPSGRRGCPSVQVPGGNRAVRVEDLGPQRGPGHDLAVEAVLGQRQREQRQRHADGGLFEPDLGGHVGPDPHVARQNQQRPGGQSVAGHGHHHRLGV